MTHSASNATRSPIAVKLVASYWLTAAIVSLFAVVVYDPNANIAQLAFVPLLPLLPVLTLVAFSRTPPINPLPLGLLLALLVYPTIFISLAKVTRLLNAAPVAVGVLGGLVNGILAGGCFRAMIRSL